MIYLDTGCLVKLYYPERDSHLVAARVAGKTICYSLLHELEFTNALHQKVFHKQATIDQVRAAQALVAIDLEDGILVRKQHSMELSFTEAVYLSEVHTAGSGCRSLDILHCALAAGLEVEDFVSTDARQIKLAQAIGLPYRVL